MGSVLLKHLSKTWTYALILDLINSETADFFSEKEETTFPNKKKI